jgi:transposase-like protein
MPKRTRRRHSSEQKAALLKRRHLERVPVSELCNKNKLQPSLFYDWQRQLFANAATVFDGAKQGSVSREQELEARIAALEAKLAARIQLCPRRVIAKRIARSNAADRTSKPPTGALGAKPGR